MRSSRLSASLVASTLALLSSTAGRVARAEGTAPASPAPPAPSPPSEPAVPAAPPAPPGPPPLPRRPPYSLPWQLRAVTVGTVFRSDTSFAKYEDAAARGGLTIASTLFASYKIPGTGPPSAGLSPLLRLAIVNDSPPLGNGGLAVVNPLLGAAYALDLGGGLRTSFFLGVTIPVGMGGGSAPDAAIAAARAKGVPARAGMDNALFAVNDFTIIPGVDLAFVAGGFTVQIEATLLQLTRVRGENVQLEASKTNFTSGLHVGYFPIAALSVGAELRYQRWLNGPFAVEKNTTLADTWTVALGPRLHVPLGGGVWIRPGIAYARALDKPLAGATPNYHIVQLDVPVSF